METTASYIATTTHKSSISTKRFIELYCKRNENFYYSDLESALLAAGYSIPAYIRSTILAFCKAEKNDKMHFCHKDFLMDYPEVEWNCYTKKVKKRSVLNWMKLGNMLKERLYPYREWWTSNGLDLEKSVKKFIDFLKRSSNKNLSFCIPGHLYRYLQDETNELDEMTFEHLLTTIYEGLLTDIDYSNRGFKQHKTSFLQWVQEVCDELIPVLSTFPARLSGIDKLMWQLYKDRNINAHGGYVERVSFETESPIIDMVILYVHTVAKYAA